MSRLAIVGIGRWGKNLLREFSKLERDIICCSRGGNNNLNWLKANYPDVGYTSNYDDILKDKTIDKIVVATPISSHYEITKKALLNSKHVFVEKPLSTNVKEAEELVQLAKRNNKIIEVGYVFLYHKVFQKIQKEIKENTLVGVRAEWNKYGSFEEDIIWNLLSHEVAIAIKLLGDPNNIRLLERKGEITNGDIVSVKLQYNGIDYLICTNRVSKDKNKRITFVFKNKTLTWENNSLFSLDTKGKKKTLFTSSAPPLKMECQDFIDSTTNNSLPYSDGRFGLNVTRILNKLFV